MKYQIIKLSLIALSFFAIMACAKSELETFKGDNSIYFEWALDGTDINSRNKIDSTAVSFAFSLPEVTETTLNIPIKTQGFVSSTDRTVKLKVVPSSTAKPAVHFDIPMVVIPADSVRAEIPVTIYRTPEMKSETLVLTIKLVPNADFNTNIVADPDDDLILDEFTVTISDILIEPARWKTIGIFLGKFSVKKLYLFAEVNGIPVPNFDEDELVISTFLAQVDNFRDYLQDQANAGTPVLEEDGSLMTAP